MDKGEETMRTTIRRFNIIITIVMILVFSFSMSALTKKQARAIAFSISNNSGRANKEISPRDRIQPPSKNIASIEPKETLIKESEKRINPKDSNSCLVESKYKKELTLDEIASFDPNSQALWPGALVSGKSVENGVLTPVILPRDKVTVSIQGATSVVGKQKIEASPSDSDKARVQMLGKGFEPAAKYSFNVKEFYSLDDAMLSIGARASWVSGNVSASLVRADYKERRNFIVSFVEQYYTYTVDPGSVMLSDKALKKLPLDINPSTNPLAYVASVTYGRRALLFVSSSYEREVVKEALSAAASWATGSAGVDLDAKSQKILQESELKLLVWGGKHFPAVLVIAAKDLRKALYEHLSKAIGVEGVRYGVPISYRLNYMDHSVMRLALATEYERVDNAKARLIGNWRAQLQTTSDDKDHDSMLTLRIRRVSDDVILSQWSQGGEEKFPNGDTRTKDLSSFNIPNAGVSGLYGQVCIRTNGKDNWDFNVSFIGDISDGGQYTASSGGNLRCKNCEACMRVNFPKSPKSENCP